MRPTLVFNVLLTLEHLFLDQVQCHNLSVEEMEPENISGSGSQRPPGLDVESQNIYLLDPTEQREHMPAICPHSWRQGSGAR